MNAYSQRLIFIFFLSLLVACSSKEGDATAGEPSVLGFGVAGTSEGRDALYLHLQEFDSIGIAANRDESHRPDKVLSQLHGWLSEGRGLERVNVSGHRALVVRKLPEKVLQDLNSSTFPQTFSSGFEILQASFWKKVKKAMDEGLLVGFLEPNPDFNASGLFMEGRRGRKGLLFFDIFAGQGTFDHEYRHFLQAEAYKKREKKRSWFDHGPIVLEEGCLENVSRFLGELDSTTVELPNWIGVFQTLDVTPSWHEKSRKGDEDPIRFPQTFLLVTNLDYPGRAAAELEGHACPKELMTAVAKIKTLTDDFSARITNDFTSKLFSLRMENFHSWKDVNSVCSVNSELPVCVKRQARLKEIPREAQEIKNAIDEAFSAEVASRLPSIQNAFAELPSDQQKDLCEYTKAYEFIFNCRPFFSTEKGN